MKTTLSSIALKRLVDATKKFTRPGDTKMQYIRIMASKEDKTITAIALDGYRVSIEKAGYIDCDESFECFIKPAYLPFKADEYATIEKIDDKAYITIGDNIIGYRQPEWEWYDTDKIIGQIKDTEVIQTIHVDAKLFKEALESVKAIGRPYVSIDIPKGQTNFIVIRHKGSKKAILPIRTKEDNN